MRVITSVSSLPSSSFFLRVLLVTLAVILLGLSGRLVLGMGGLGISISVSNFSSWYLYISIWPLFILAMVGIPFPRHPRGRCTAR